MEVTYALDLVHRWDLSLFYLNVVVKLYVVACLILMMVWPQVRKRTLIASSCTPYPLVVQNSNVWGGARYA